MVVIETQNTYKVKNIFNFVTIHNIMVTHLQKGEHIIATSTLKIKAHKITH